MTASLSGSRRSRASWPAIVAKFGRLLPPYPSFDRVPVARVPGPPLVTAVEPWAIASHLAAAFRSVNIEWFGECSHQHRHVCTARLCERLSVPDDIFSKLVAAGDELRALNIAPIAWCAFSAVAWCRYNKKRAKYAGPPVAWTYSLKRLGDRLEWYSWCEQMFRGGRLLHEPEHSKLLLRYERMRYALLTATAPLTDELVKRIVDRMLPQATYQALLNKIEDKVEDRQRDLNKRVRDHEWVWG